MSILTGKEWSPGLSEAEEQTLFRIANDTLAWCTLGHYGSFSFGDYDITEKLRIKRATFVTLKINGELRGCIGSLEPVEELYLSVHHNAANAAMRDPRFEPLDPNELPLLNIQITILSPMVPIGDISEFKIGEHGIVLTKGYNRAVFLPEVATEQGWNVEQTLSALSRKAGLGPDAWRDDASFEIFAGYPVKPELSGENS